MTTKDKQYTHIWIDGNGVLFAINAPEMPGLVKNYRVFHPNLAMQYDEALAKAKQEPQAVRFRKSDAELIIQDIFDKYGKKGQLIEGRHLYNTIQEIPEGYRAELEKTCKWHGNRDACGNERCWDLKECQESPSAFVALLKKLSPESAAPVSGKEEMREKFKEFLKTSPEQFHSLHKSDVLDFFWDEIRSVIDRKNGEQFKAFLKWQEKEKELQSENARLRSLVKAAEEELSSKQMLLKELWFKVKSGQTVSETFLNTVSKALENYQQLKGKI